MGFFDRFKKKDIQSLEKKSFSSVNIFKSGSFLSGAQLSYSYAYWLAENVDAINDICQRVGYAFQQLKPVLRNKKTGEYIIDGHPILDLLDNPGMGMSSEQFKYELMTSYLLTGACFPVLVGNVNFDPSSIYTEPASKFALIENGNSNLQTINLNKGRVTIFEREEITKRKIWVYQTRDKLSETIQLLTQRRKNGVYAQSPLQAIYQQCLTKYYGNIHNANLLKQGNRPGGLWSPTESLDQDTYESFANSISSARGSGGAGRDIITNEPLNYTDLFLNPRDMDFVNLMQASSNDIYNQYQIPLALITTSAMTMNNYENAIASFYDMCVIPRAKVVYSGLGRFALSRYKDGDRFELTFDEKEITALKGRMLDRAKTMREIYSFSENEIRGTVGYESIGTEGDLIYKPATIIPVETDDYTDDNRNTGLPDNQTEQLDIEDDE